ncbi:hypothetical protein [Mesorhizobium sp. ANAO-SY3R2]|uniref:hypothetical protein n=1 Tax=Mesorhizobium sp. ANAO-SY3R2 TaxID=3166644 RepID=UPI00366F46CC
MIEELAGRDEEFHSLCADLADAEAELMRWESSDHPLREERTAEYRALVGELAAEIEAALDASAIIPLHGRYPKPPI